MCHFLLLFLHNIVVKLHSLYILGFQVVVLCEVGLAGLAEGDELLIGEGGDVVFVKVGRLDVDVAKGVDCGLGDEGVGDGGEADLEVVVVGLVRAVGVRPGRH